MLNSGQLKDFWEFSIPKIGGFMINFDSSYFSDGWGMHHQLASERDKRLEAATVMMGCGECQSVSIKYP